LKNERDQGREKREEGNGEKIRSREMRRGDEARKSRGKK
jgi:hypothetical protein